MKAHYTSTAGEWDHYFPSEIGKHLVNERLVNETAQLWANKYGKAVTVTYRHDGVKCTGCDDDGMHRNTFHPMPK